MPPPSPPTGAQDLFLAGLMQHQAGNVTEAQALYLDALGLEPRHFDALHLSGVAAYQLGDPGRARELICRAIDLNPRLSAPYANLGNALRGLGEHAAALASLDHALILQPDDPIVHSNRGIVLADLGKFSCALASYDRALELDPGYADAHSNRGNALRALGRHEEAIEHFDRAVALDPTNASVHANRGGALQEQGRHAEAIASFDRAIAQAPALAIAHRQRGVSLDHLGDHRAALESYDAAIRLSPLDPDSYAARGNARRAVNDLGSALADYARAIALDPRCKVAHFNRGAVLDDLKDFPAAAESYAAVLQLQPDYPHAAGLHLHARRQICDWEDATDRACELGRSIRAKRNVAMPFHCLALTDSPEAQRLAAELWINERRPAAPLWRGERYRHARVRVAYLSADFCDHPVSHLIAGVLERHNQRRFETIGVSLRRHPAADPMHRRMRQAFGEFHDVDEVGDRQVAMLLHEREVDIAVDLTGHTGGGRPGILAFRPAPVQVNFLGYAGTSGAGYMDYVIGDAVAIPTGQERFFSEKIIRMPHTFLPNDDRQPIAAETPTRRALGLPDTGFVFCAFNNTFKLGPGIFDIWMRLLKALPGSVLWLRGGDGVALENLALEAEFRGVDAARLIFATRMPAMPEHLARYRAADLFLDTLPYGAHATARDALWAGLPVLTCAGNTFAGRVAASLLTALDMPELVTSSLEEYAVRALALASSPQLLASVRGKLGRQRLTRPAFDTDLYRRDLESAYVEVCARRCRGEECEDFNLPAMQGPAQ